MKQNTPVRSRKREPSGSRYPRCQAASSVARNWRQHEDSASGPFILRSPDRKTRKKFASTPRAVKFLLCKRKDQEIRPKSLRKTIKRLASGEGFNLWITKSRKTLIEY